ncbi:hypothetical protein KAR91_82025, partial [Candidatus Pacearchaeota archaeon]|nr:hypothetical protein [Candidatus Pacearchaeota archaeon]
MASGDTLFELFPERRIGPFVNAATPDFVEEASTPPAIISVLDFDGAIDESADWKVEIPSCYSEATGFTFSFKYAMDGTNGNIV